MKLVIIGAPGSGKTWLASELSYLFNLKQIEADQLFWQGEFQKSIGSFREDIDQATQQDDWVFEGHISKVFDIVLPRADKIIVIDHPNSLSFMRVMKRDLLRLMSGPGRLRSLKKMLFNLQNYEKMKQNREELISKLKNAILWENGTEPLEALLIKLRI